MKEILFVTKPLSPPWNDSGKNIPAGIAKHIKNYKIHLLTTKKGTGISGSHIVEEKIYGVHRSFKPNLKDYASVLRRLFVPDFKISMYHFFFTPNKLTSSVLALVKRLKFKKRIVQNINSTPAGIKNPKSLIFGDVNVVMSRFTEKFLKQKGVKNLKVIYPFIEPIPEESLDTSKFDFGGKPVVIYPGDYEFSKGIYVFVETMPLILKKMDAHFVIACRRKTERAIIIEKTIKNLIDVKKLTNHVTFVGETRDFYSLLKASDVVLFPVDTLYAKMDIPIVILEAMYLGVPVVLSKIEPLSELGSFAPVIFIDIEKPYEIAENVCKILSDENLRRGLQKELKNSVVQNFLATKVVPRYQNIYDELLK